MNNNDTLLSKTAPMPAYSSNKTGQKGKEKDKKPALQMTLDHRNFLNTVTHKAVAIPTKKIKKTTKAPPVRSFPGELNVTSTKSKTTGFSYDDQLVEEEKSEPKTELSAEDLMRDPEYLKIDQSKLPLEMFDNIELEALDKTPEEWISSGSQGKTPYYHSGEWLWRPVIVTGYDAETQEYEVQFSPSGIAKKVKRLNLHFDEEDASKFEERRRVAEQARKEAKSTLRMDYFIGKQPKQEVRIIRKESIRKIHGRVVDGLPLTIPFPEKDTPLGKVLKSLTGEIIQFYTHTMKKTVLFAKLRDDGPSHDPAMVARTKQLRLPPPPPKPPVPRNGKVPCPPYPYYERIQRIENLHYSSVREVLNVFKWLHNKWIQTFQFYNFFDVQISAETLPCYLKEFKELQMEKAEATMKLLQKDFHRAFMDQFMDCVQDIFDFFQSNLQVYRSGSLHKLFRVLDLKLGNFMRSMLMSSLYGLKDLVFRHTNVIDGDNILMKDHAAVTGTGGGDSGRASPEPVRQVGSADIDDAIGSIASNNFSETKDGAPTTTATPPAAAAEPDEAPVELTEEELEELEELRLNEYKKKLISRQTETIFHMSPQVPLFHVELVFAGNSIQLEPSLADVQVTFSTLIDRTVVTLRSLNSIDKDTMSLLILEPRTLFNIGAGDPLYKDVDDTIADVKRSISERLARSFLAPQLLAKLYNSYLWLMSDEPNDYLRSFMEDRAAPPTRDDYKEELDKLNNAMFEISELSFSHENFSLVRVNTETISQMLYNRARELRDGLSQIVVTEARQNNIHIIEQYNSILERIAEKPVNEKQLAELREFIEQSRETVGDLKKNVQDTRELLDLLDLYNVPLSIEDMGLSWSTLEYPSKVEHSGKEVEIALEADKIRMMDRLAMQKDQFERVVDKLGLEVKEGLKLDDYADKEKIVERINTIMDNITDAKNKGDDFNMREKVFGFAPTDYAILDKYAEELSPVYKLWNMVSDFHNSKNDWLHGDFKDLDGKQIDETVTDWWKTSYKLNKALEEELPGAASCASCLREETTEFRKNMPVIQSLASKALKRRHWELLSELLGKNIDPEDELTLQNLLDLDAAGHIEAIQEVTIAAEKEYNLERGMNAMKKEWETIEFEVKAYKESGTFVVGGVDDIITLLDDHIVKTQTMRGSPYIKPIEKEIKEWEYCLKYAQGMLDAMIGCQRTWMYLEPIFGSEDIMRQLPTEARRFQGVDQLWRKTLNEVNQDPNFMTTAGPDKRLEEKFKKANEKLDEITKGLNDYLEVKRLYFPRFFFLSNDELLEILSQTKEPRAVQPHLGKCFEGINKVKFEEDLKISQIISAEGEVVKLDKMVDPESGANKGNVEKWLLEIESIQWDSIRTLTVGSIEEYTKITRKQWILNWPAQVILGVSQVYWTSEVTAALMKGGDAALKTCNDQLNVQLKDMVELVRGKLSKLERKTLGALTTIDVHNRDVVTKMVSLGTKEVSDFEWMSQLRYYWEDAWTDGQAVKKGMLTLVARIVNARCLYGYEYLGNTMRLVITALTDRCYRTMIGAVDLLYGGAPEGPAGTGKTETVKGNFPCTYN